MSTLSIEDVVGTALRGHASRILDNTQGIADGGDIHAVHQGRVGARRLRSDLRTFGPQMRRRWRRLDGPLRTIGSLLAPLRDIDVRLTHVRSDQVRERVRQTLLDDIEVRLAAERAEAAIVLRAWWDSDAAILLLHELRQVTAAEPPARLTRHPHADARDLLLPGAIAAWVALRRGVEALDDTPSDAALHHVRILAKRARYAIAALGPVIPEITALVGLLAAVQDVLGEHEDAATTHTWLSTQPGLAGDPAWEHLLAIEHERRAVARAAFRRAWDAALDPKHRIWMLP